MENMEMNRVFWKGKKVLITGHTGFKGSWLSLWLHLLGADVIGYSLQPPSKPNLYEVAHIGEFATSIHGDVCDLDLLCSTISTHRPDIVFHMAAQSLVRASYEFPLETYATNVMGTLKVLEAIRLSGNIRAAIMVTSDKCYENKEWFWGYRENEPMGGYDPYSSSKGCAELVISAYRRSFFSDETYGQHGLAIASVRAGNVIGGGDWADDRLIPDIVKSVVEERPVVIRNPDSVRPWQHVLEPLLGYLLLAERLWESGPRFAGAWNFGPMDYEARPVSWIVETLLGCWEGGGSWKLSGQMNQHEAHYLKLDSSKARQLLGWSARLDLMTGLKWIAEWYHAHGNNHDMRSLTEEQILRYERLLQGDIDHDTIKV